MKGRNSYFFSEENFPEEKTYEKESDDDERDEKRGEVGEGKNEDADSKEKSDP